jgi:Putative restriction endonuclease
MRLSYALQNCVNEAPGRGYVLPPTDVDIDEHNVFAPDLLWVSSLRSARERLPRIPDVCVEIRSPSTRRYDVGTKLVHDKAAGLRELWLVDAVAESVIVQRRSPARRTSTSRSSCAATTAHLAAATGALPAHRRRLSRHPVEGAAGGHVAAAAGRRPPLPPGSGG